jgi:hypothetical protein
MSARKYRHPRARTYQPRPRARFAHLPPARATPWSTRTRASISRARTSRSRIARSRTRPRVVRPREPGELPGLARWFRCYGRTAARLRARVRARPACATPLLPRWRPARDAVDRARTLRPGAARGTSRAIVLVRSAPARAREKILKSFPEPLDAGPRVEEIRSCKVRPGREAGSGAEGASARTARGSPGPGSALLALRR